jgi:glycine/D-amino acid oxidase-like deaminating enzyme
MTPDALPVVAQVGAVPELVLATGLSEPGFEIGPGAGQLATRSLPVVNLAPCRFLQISDG